MSDHNVETDNWPEMAAQLFDKLTGRHAEITYDFNEFEVRVPGSTGKNTSYANWKLNGVLKIRTKDGGHS